MLDAFYGTAFLTKEFLSDFFSGKAKLFINVQSKSNIEILLKKHVA